MKYSVSNELKKYIEQLEKNHNKSNNSQIVNAYKTAAKKVLENPTSTEFLKHTIGAYRAVDVLGQVRLFFSIEDNGNEIFFVWMNDPEEFPHDSSRGQRDRCYLEFKRLYNNDKLEKYKKEEDDSIFKLKGRFRANEKLTAYLKSKLSEASTNLEMCEIDHNTYEIFNVYESCDYSGAFIELIEKVLEIAKKDNIQLSIQIEDYWPEDKKNSIISAIVKSGFEKDSECLDDKTIYKSNL